MSAATALTAPTASTRPRLVVIHRGQQAPAPDDADPAAAGAANCLQDELPLHWPTGPDGGAARAGLASYPALPLRVGIPRPDPYVADVARLLADVLVGARPATQLTRHAILDVCQELARRGALRRGASSGPRAPARVLSTSTMVVAPTAVQATMVFRDGERAHGAALRLEFRHGRWMLTDVQAA